MDKYFIVNLATEYPDFVGDNTTGIISDMSETALLIKFPELQQYAPLQVFTTEMWNSLQNIKNKYLNNEAKHRMRSCRHSDGFGYRDGETEVFMCNIDVTIVEKEVMSNINNAIFLKIINEKLRKATAVRATLAFLYGFTESEIATYQGVSQSAVHQSLDTAKKILKKFLKKPY